MMRMMSITTTSDGQFEIVDQSMTRVAGPFASNADAWAALDRMDAEGGGKGVRRRKGRKVLWGKPEAKETAKKRRGKSSKASRKEIERMKRDAAKAPNWVRTVAAVKHDPEGARKFRDYKLGTFGPASPVKRIDPAEYLAAKSRGEA